MLSTGEYLHLATTHAYTTGKASLESVGITEFTTGNFQPIRVASRDSPLEFIVQEIPLGGQPLTISSTEIPNEELAYANEKTQTRSEDRKRAFIFKKDVCAAKKIRDDGYKEIERIAGQAVAEGFRSYAESFYNAQNCDGKEQNLPKNAQNCDGKEQNAETVFKVGPRLDKSARTELHRAVKMYFPKLGSRAVEEADQRTLLRLEILPQSVLAGDGGGGRRHPASALMRWFKTTGRPFLRFALLKENRTTSEVVAELSEKLKISPTSLRICGNKDKHGLTIQSLSARHVTASRLAAASARVARIAVGNFEYHAQPVRLGQLGGNRFTVALRGADASGRTAFAAAAALLRERGFVNYFGLQRFGTSNVPTHVLGRLLIQKKWDELLALVLFPNGEDVKENDAFRKILIQRKSFGLAFDACPSHLSVEKSVLRALKNGRAGREAVDAINRSMRSLYVHAFQSFVWNKVASARFRRFGLAPAEGDLVSAGDAVQTVSAADVAAARYSVADVVLPLLASKAVMPGNGLWECYEEIMAQEGVTLQMFESIEKDRSLMVAPVYRKFIAKPANLKIDLFDNARDGVLEYVSAIAGCGDKVNKRLGDGVSCVLQFDLQPSCYATMLLREITKE